MSQSNQCLRCQHHTLGAFCAAFPEGIPKEIWAGLDHTKPFKGDHGIRFEPFDPTKPRPPLPDMIKLGEW